MSTIEGTLRHLQDHYVDAVNRAIAADDTAGAEQLAADFDVEVLDTIRRQLAAA